MMCMDVPKVQLVETVVHEEIGQNWEVEIG